MLAATACAKKATGDEALAAPKESAADKHYDVAVGSFHNGMFEDAKLQLERALAIDPQHADSHYLRGVLLLNEGKAIVDAVEIDQCLTDEAARQQRERAQGLHSAAAQSFEQAANAFPDGAAGRGRAFNSLSVVALYFHHHEIAAKRAEQALKERFYTERYSALSNLGWAHYHRGDLVSATAQLRQAVLINPDYCVGHYRLAQVYLEAGQPQKAREHAQMVVDEPRCPIQDAYRILGVAIVRSGEAEGASEAFQGCTELAPRSCLAGECRKLLAPYVAQGEEQSGP